MSAERDRDLLQRLRAVNPVRAGELDDLVWALPAQALFQRIVAYRPSPTAPDGLEWRSERRIERRIERGSSGHRRRAPRVAALAAVLCAGAVVSGYALAGRHASKPQTVACFEEADLAALTAVVGPDRNGPVAACAAVWAGGFFGAGPRPPLRACVLDSGSVGVFPERPGQDVCLDLGLAAIEVVPVAEVDPGRIVVFRDAVLARLAGPGCVGAAQAEAIVRAELAEAGLVDWAVTTGVDAAGGGFSSARPCASLSFLPEQRTVVLVPLPEPQAAG